MISNNRFVMLVVLSICVWLVASIVLMSVWNGLARWQGLGLMDFTEARIDILALYLSVLLVLKAIDTIKE